MELRVPGWSAPSLAVLSRSVSFRSGSPVAAALIVHDFHVDEGHVRAVGQEPRRADNRSELDPLGRPGCRQFVPATSLPSLIPMAVSVPGSHLTSGKAKTKPSLGVETLLQHSGRSTAARPPGCWRSHIPSCVVSSG